jgi:hypothetical protein
VAESETGVYGRLFPRDQIPIILSSIFEVSRTLRKKTIDDREDWITTRLYSLMVRSTAYRDSALTVYLKPKIVSQDPDANTPVGEIDLLVSCGYGYEVYFAIEAKRLRVCATNGRLVFAGSYEYVADGMMRFVTGQYAPLMEIGTMLGYVFDGNIGEARVGIGRSIQSKAEQLRLKAPYGLIRSRILPDKPVDETIHDLGQRSFTIYHILLAV